jgi:DNA-binding PadR family transcriptional regulator
VAGPTGRAVAPPFTGRPAGHESDMQSRSAATISGQQDAAERGRRRRARTLHPTDLAARACLDHATGKCNRTSGAARALTCIRYGYSVGRMAHGRSDAPLTPAVLHILLALSTGDRHGYGIMKQVQLDSRQRVKMGPGTLYGSLRRMIDAGLIRESAKRIDPDMDDERRVYYQMTGLGQEALAAELERYRELVIVAKRMRLLPNASAHDA